MKKSLFFIGFSLVALSVTSAKAQINLGERALGALQNGVASFTFTNEDAAKLSLEAVTKMDKDNKVAGAKDAYAIRLNKIFGKHAAEDGLKLNYKVYLTKDVNAFATADGSVRVFSGLMDLMDDNQLLAVIGHEIGHVAHHDSRDGMKAAYRKAALIDAVASQSGKIAALTDSQLGQIGSAMLDSKHTRGMESEADNYSYNFMKKHGYNVNAVESAFLVLAKMSGGTESNFLTQMMSSHPEPQERANEAHNKAVADGLYKEYVVVKKSTKKVVKKKK